MRNFVRAALICVLPLLPTGIRLDKPMIDIPLQLEVEEHVDMPKNFLDDFQKFVKTQLTLSGSPGAAIAIIKDHQLVFLEGYGTRKADRSIYDMPVNAHSVFRIGSLSKGFSALLAAKLIDEEYFNWDDPVQKFVPNFQLKNKSQSQRICIKHILSHTTGLARHAYTNLTELGFSLSRVLPYFSSVDVYGREGNYYGYQNTAFSMIEEVVAQSTQRSFNEMLDEKIFAPAQMNDASSTYRDIKQDFNVALPHQFWRKKRRYVPVRLNKKYFNAVSAGGINASISDMAQWMQVLLGNMPKVASNEVLDAIFTPVISTKRFGEAPLWAGLRDAWYGMGWRILQFEDRELMYHGGSVNDYRSEIAIDRNNKIGICILSNAQNSATNNLIRDFFKRYDKYKLQEDRFKFIASS